MSCILRVGGPDLIVNELLKELKLKPYRIDRKGERKSARRTFTESAVHFMASDRDFEDFEGQISDATDFLTTNFTEVQKLVAFSGVADPVLDFGVTWESGFFCDRLPAELISFAGSLGLALEVSHYPISEATENNNPASSLTEQKIEDFEKQVKKFSDLAEEYCCWAESIPNSESEEHLKALIILSRLYATALILPEVEPSEDFTSEEPPEVDYHKVHKRFGSLPFQYYNDVFNPLAKEPEEPSVGDVCDDLADIYKDLKRGLWYFQRKHFSDAACHWKMHFGIHWGRHATSALKALHCYEPEDE